MSIDLLNSVDKEEDPVKITLFIDVIHQFSQDIISAKSEVEIFKILANEVARQMDFLDCVIYKVDNSQKKLKQVASLGSSKYSSLGVSNSIELDFGQGHAGTVAQTGETLLVDDVTKSSNYLLDIVQAGSELVVPVKINNVVYAVITSEHPEKYFYKVHHQKILEVITSIAVGALVKIQETKELEAVKEKLEIVIQKKSSDLDIAIDTLSEQYSTLKYQHERQESLIQEVNHRVTNNLQIISSILRLYLAQEKSESISSLKEVHNRVQAMALIYKNVYKSIEVNLVNINSYLYDLISYLKSSLTGNNFEIDVKAEFEHFGADVLVPLGLYITEMYYYWFAHLPSDKTVHLELNLTKEQEGDYAYCICLSDNSNIQFSNITEDFESDEVSLTLISALVDQLDGRFVQEFNNGNILKLKF